jgi:hypothetical protein
MKQVVPDKVMKLVIKRTEAFWICAGIPFSETKDRKTLKMLKSFILKINNSSRHMERESQQDRLQEFLESTTKLFDIARCDAEGIIMKDPMRTEVKKSEDLAFILDQRGPRSHGLGKEDKQFELRVAKRERRQAAVLKRHEDYQQQSLQQTNTPSADISNGDSESAPESDSESAYSPCKRVRSEIPSRTITIPVDVIKSKDFNQTADSTGLSIRHRIRLLSSIYRSAIDTSNPKIKNEMSNVVLSSTTAYKASKSTRESIACEIKENFVPPKHASVHLDAKKVTDSCSKGRKKTERLVVYVAGAPDHIEGKLLGTAVIKSKAECGVRMGRSEATEVNKLCDSWGVSKNIIAQVFDTTATNTGCENGACTIFEAEFLKRKVLWCACRRHVDEVILSDVWKSFFGKTSSPDNELFQEFRDDIWFE